MFHELGFEIREAKISHTHFSHFVTRGIGIDKDAITLGQQALGVLVTQKCFYGVMCEINCSVIVMKRDQVFAGAYESMS